MEKFNSESCEYCDGTGLVDSGGFQPWGEPINVPCICQQRKLQESRCIAALQLIAALGDTGSDEFKSRFDAERFTGWQVAQAMREVANDAVGSLPKE